MGSRGSRYCPDCLWDELEDPVIAYRDDGSSRAMSRTEYIEQTIEDQKAKLRRYQYGI